MQFIFLISNSFYSMFFVKPFNTSRNERNQANLSYYLKQNYNYCSELRFQHSAFHVLRNSYRRMSRSLQEYFLLMSTVSSIFFAAMGAFQTNPFSLITLLLAVVTNISANVLLGRAIDPSILEHSPPLDDFKSFDDLTTDSNDATGIDSWKLNDSVDPEDTSPIPTFPISDKSTQ